MKQKKNFVKACFFILVFLVSIISCEIGLGSAVDTQPPSVSISYPPSLSVIRDSFVFAGNWSDDRSIEGIYVEVYQIKDDQKTVVFKEQADKVEQIENENKQVEGTWSINLNQYNANNPDWYNGWQFCDGDYEIQVYAKDNAKQVSSIASRTVSIDNSAPVLLLTNPTSAGSDASPASFGQIIQLTGYFYEFTGKISNLIVSFYDETGNALFDTNFTNITSMSDSSPLVVARYFTSQEERTENSQIFSNYIKLLGEDQIDLFEQGQNVENKKVYFTVTACDNAREYKTVGDNGTGDGNLTKQFYRGTTSMQNLVSGDGGIENFSLTDFAQYMNGTSNKYKGYSQTINQISSAARSVSVTNKTAASVANYISNNDSKNGDPVYLTFVLNPKNNPLYSFGGYEIDQSADTDNYTTNGYKFVYSGTSVPLSITVGTDNKNISTHTVSVYKVDKKAIQDANITAVINDAFFKNEAYYRAGYFDLMHTWDSEVVERISSWGFDTTNALFPYTETDPDANVASISKQFEIKELHADHEYEFYVVGEDITGSKILATKTRGYGFCGKVSKTVPEIKVTSTDFIQNSIVNEAVFKGTDADGNEGAQNKVLYLTGTIKTEEKLIDDITESNKFGFGYKLTISNSTSNRELVKTITKVTAVPEATDKTSNYCYKTNDTSPYIYNWRFTTAEIAENDDVKTFIVNPDSYTLSLELIAYNGENSKSNITRTFTLDTQPPAPEWTKMSVQVPKKDAVNTYYINPNNALTISGIVTDNLSPAKNCSTYVELVAFNREEDEEGNITITPVNSTTGGSTKWNYKSSEKKNNWEITIPAKSIADSYYGAHLYIYSQDEAENKNVYDGTDETKTPITLIFDTTAPKAIHKIDSKNKDVVVRIGNNDNDDITSATAANFKTNNIALTWDQYTPTGATKPVTGIDTDVGKKYSNLSYGNSETVKIRGFFEETGSGIDLVYYKVFSEQPNNTNNYATDFLAHYKEKADGWFSTTDSVTKRVFYNKDDSHNYDGTLTATSEVINEATGETETITLNYIYQNYNYYTSIPGLKNPNNYLVLVAVDKVGNASLDSESVGDETYDNYQLNVDNSVPVVSSAEKFQEVQFLKSDDDNAKITVYGKVTDNLAGIRSLVVKVNGKEITKDDNTYGTIEIIKKGSVPEELALDYGSETLSSTNALWKAEIKNTAFAGIDSGKSVSVQITATDDSGSGNSETYSVANIMIDTDGPTVSIKSPAKDSTENKTIILSGSASDGNNGSGISTKQTDKPVLYFSTAGTAPATESKDFIEKENAAEGWKKLTNPPTVDDGVWEFTIDTTAFNNTNAESYIYFTVSSVDAVGNKGYAPAHKLKINQNSDRPVIKFTNVNLATISGDETIPMDSTHPVWIKKQEIWGSVSDDDGEIKSVHISFDNKATWESCWTAQDGLSYTFPSDGTKDGSQTIYFKVVDANDTEFISSVATEADIGAPKLAYQTLEYGNAADKYSTVLYANVDLKEPSIPCLYYSTEDYSSLTSAVDLDALFDSTKLKPADTTKWKELSNLTQALGGDTNYVYILVKARDANKIKEIKSVFAENTLIVKAESEGTVTVGEQTDKTKAALFEIDISEIGKTTVEKKKIEVSVKDEADHSHNNSYTIEIDNVPPVVDIDSPSANAELYGTAGVAQTSVTVRGRTSDSSDVQDIYLAVTKGEDVQPATSGVSAYKSIKKRSALSWTAVFNGNSDSSEDVYYTDLFNTYIDALYGEGTTTSVSQKDICLWLYAVDNLGNSGKENPKKLPLTILTQGDKPIVSITYPSKESKVGGVITITGSTSIATNEVDKIFIQIDPAYNHENPAYNIAQNEFADNWETSLQTLIDTATGAGKTIEYSIENIENSEGTVVAKGILAGGSKQSWNVILNAASEFNTEGNRDIAVRAYAISKSNKVSEPVITWFTLDPDSPTFGNNDPLTLVQYSNNTAGTGSITASMLYTPGMWIQGKWWLTGSVEDESGIDYVKLNGIDLESQYCVVETTPYKGRKLNIPVGKAIDSETVYGPTIKLVTKESGGEKTSQMDIKLYYDNTPPEFESTTLKADQTNTLVQSDGVCEIKGTLKELGDQSGFKRIAFYVTRTLNSTNYVTDVMKAQGSGTDNCYTQNSLTSDGNLYWKTAANCTAKNGIEIEVPQDEVPAFARTGGLCRINDVIYTIKSITAGANGKKIITIDSKIDNGTVDVDFILAQVIDNTVSELGITTYFGDTTHGITNDDGDEMVESYKESSGEWTVSINSKNIKDGTIKIHFVAYDQAGNKTYKTYNAIVANNAPRIAGVKFGTDTNGNGEVEGSELRTGYSGIYAVEGLNKKPNITVNGQAANGVKISKLALPNNGTDVTAIDDTKNSVMTVKGAIKIIPEVVGGNNGLSWTYSVNGTNKSTSANSLNNTHSGNDDIRSESATTISIDTLTLLKDISSDGNTVLGFTIWDKTEGTTPGTDSNKAELLLKVNVELRDETPPTAGIKPFYWDSIPIGDKNNSSVVYKDGIAFGHIELEKDLPKTGFDYDGTDGQEFDLDPKVSGVIYLEGFAKDNVAVEKLYLNFPGLSGFGNFGLVAQRDRRDNSSTKGQMISVPNFADDGIELVSATEELKAEGNKEYNLVHWKIKIDTSRIATSAATNVLVQIKAEDRGKATLNGSGTSYDYQNPKKSSVPESFDLSKDQTGYKLVSGSVQMSNGRPVYDSENQTPSYRIDVVPYIAKVYTSLASLKKNNWSVYNRTALGHYPVASDGTAYLYGFNLGKTGYLPTYGAESLAEPADGATANNDYPSGPKSDTNPESEYAAYKVVTFPVSNVTTSGAICLKVNGVETLNNKNNNEGRGSYTGYVNLEINPTGDETTYSTYYYNRQPNGDNNNLLTDDVEMDVWEIDPEAVQSKKGSIAQPVMAINPVNHDIGFAFVNGALSFTMPNSGYSYDYSLGGIDYWTSIGLAYDSKGNSYATAAGGDINASVADQFRIMTSRWGRGTLTRDGYNDGKNQLRLELIGQADFSGTTNPVDDGYNTFDKERIQSPSIALTNATNDSTKVYLAYYDGINNEIRFKHGVIKETKDKTWKNLSAEEKTASLLGDYFGKDSENGAKRNGKTLRYDDTPYDIYYYSVYQLSHNSLLAGQTKNIITGTEANFVSTKTVTSLEKVSKVVTTTSGVAVCAGKYVSIAAIEGGGIKPEGATVADDAVIAVWWDATNNQLLYSYNKNPSQITIGEYTQADTGWSTPKAIFGEGNGIGEYCKVVVDKKKGVHIAAYDGLNGDLWYAYIPQFDDPETNGKCLVDSYGIIGTELNIDVVQDDSEEENEKKPIPYISYYAGSCAKPKMAYWAGKTTLSISTLNKNSGTGVVDEVFTGGWEVTVIPTTSKISIDHVNIGAWKDSDGKLTWSTMNGEDPSSGGTIGEKSFLPGAGSTDQSYGMVYGNGSKNPVLGYAITKGSVGYIETAQMK